MGQHHLLGEAAAAELDHDVGAGLGRRAEVDAEAVHAQDEAGFGQLAQVVGVGGVAAVAEDDAPRVHALLVAHHPLHDEAGWLPGWVCTVMGTPVS